MVIDQERFNRVLQEVLECGAMKSLDDKRMSHTEQNMIKEIENLLFNTLGYAIKMENDRKR